MSDEYEISIGDRIFMEDEEVYGTIEAFEMIEGEPACFVKLDTPVDGHTSGYFLLSDVFDLEEDEEFVPIEESTLH